MPKPTTLATSIAVVAATLPMAVLAQTCKVGEITRAQVEDRFKTEMQALLTTDLKAQGRPNEELFKSVGPPPSAGGSRLVDGASFTDVVAIAVENEFLKHNEGQTSLQITPFAWQAALDPTILNDPNRYNTTGNRWARRFALTFATGGKGEKFDRDGDGTADDPLEAGDFNDIHTWELKFRLLGSQDWKENLEQLAADAGDPVPTAMEYAQLNLSMAQNGVLDPANPNCVKEALFVLYLKSPQAQASLLKLAHLNVERNQPLRDRLKKISTGWTTSIVAGTTQQEARFGQDKWSTGFRFSRGDSKRATNINLDYSQANGRAQLPDPNSWKIGAEYVSYLLPGKFGESGIKTSLSAVWEMFDDIPDATHDDIGRVGVRFEIPIAGSNAVKLPLSITWANHEDVLTESDSVFAHIGLTVDFEDALKKSE